MPYSARMDEARRIASDNAKLPTLLSKRGENMPFELSAPKVITFIISIIIAAIAVVIHYAHIDLPHVHSGFVILLVSYLVLVAGNVLSGV
jgi:hypothetical protein